MSNKKTNNKPANNKISLFGEMSMMSVAAIVCLIILVICCVAFYFYMSSSPKKHVVVDDDARIFTSEQEDELEELAERLSKRYLYPYRSDAGQTGREILLDIYIRYGLFRDR